MIGTALRPGRRRRARGGDTLMGMLPIILMFVILYFLMIRPQMKQAKEHKTMLEALQKGDEVVAVGHPRQDRRRSTENYVSLEIAPNVEIQVQKQAVSTLLPKGTDQGRASRSPHEPVPDLEVRVIAIALLVSMLYTAPNFFGELPAVQVSGGAPTVKVDAAMLAQRRGGAQGRERRRAERPSSRTATLRFRFADTDTQLKARDVIAGARSARATSSALNLVPNSPHWLQAPRRQADVPRPRPARRRALPAAGGHAAAAKTSASSATSATSAALLRDKKIHYSGIAREGDRIVIRFREADQRAAALKLLADADARPRRARAGRRRRGAAGRRTIKPEVVKREQELALQQNIHTLRNRVNELGVAEPIVQQQGADRIVVQLAGVQDPARAKEILGRTATLEVRLVAEEHARGPGPATRSSPVQGPAGALRHRQVPRPGRPPGAGEEAASSSPATASRRAARLRPATAAAPSVQHDARRHRRAHHAPDHAREPEEAHGDHPGREEQAPACSPGP